MSSYANSLPPLPSTEIGTLPSSTPGELTQTLEPFPIGATKRSRRRSAQTREAFSAIFLLFTACAVFGRVTVRTPS
jgi:hypothetical protein